MKAILSRAYSCAPEGHAVMKYETVAYEKAQAAAAAANGVAPIVPVT